ncbi:MULTISPECIES: SDR family oxidoreductase [Alphaproteobacteria]|uniref:Beta-D-hydroxybutyrate dehydrogenase n=2 Tax=Alphaproteobacteria TaxID=28211 RepID=A0A512HNT3_9HYPH|nr:MULTISPECIES: SDR family NAD(P)-dependent oxidoreductase [Alphaproteobacteria]GEO87104.1 beta-D-hydroxybutyrate dehydrogenase [Ciceribacter naphthalenivorans]GLR22642.1 beta-D-hydroxybutyrate dehydrogenase [Ciceribacter naphthalenivorans]GLT05498.1 beta-D-hydroxybutyrate dehydrogenase [Sphingomonas psychrolutea]
MKFPSGRGVLITGSAVGLGLELARSFAKAGDRVFLTDILPDVEDAADGLAEEIGRPVGAVEIDLSETGAAACLVDEAESHLGQIDVLINNAVVRKMSPVETLGDADWDRALEVNLSAPFRLIRACLPKMRERNQGRIINMASVYSLMALAGRADYVTTKHAMIGLTRTVALELAATRITCNAICPGLMATDSALERIKTLANDKGISRDEAERLFLSTRQPGGKFIPIETVTALAQFLCGPSSEGINGAAIPVDNGWSFA